MTKCFLSHSSAYQGAADILQRLLQALELEVDVFDGPDLERPPMTVAEERIKAANCVVLLLGPHERTSPDASEVEPAPWPAEEGGHAKSTGKPIALIVHPGTRVPQRLQHLQTPARFDFWDTDDFARNIHHIVKHILDLKRRVDLPPGDQPFVSTRTVSRSRIQRRGELLSAEIYHEVVARQECSKFFHHLDTGMDQRSAAVRKLVADDAFEIEATLNPGRHHVRLEILEETKPSVLAYAVHVDPPLLPGERLGYRRTFEMYNHFPLTPSQLIGMSEEVGFPELYKLDGRVYYGTAWKVGGEMDSIYLSIHFPRKYRVRSRRVLAYSQQLRAVNRVETERCNLPECLSITEAPDSGERVLALEVRRPIIGHNYLLLYEPDTVHAPQ